MFGECAPGPDPVRESHSLAPVQTCSHGDGSTVAMVTAACQSCSPTGHTLTFSLRRAISVSVYSRTCMCSACSFYRWGGDPLATELIGHKGNNSVLTHCVKRRLSSTNTASASKSAQGQKSVIVSHESRVSCFTACYVMRYHYRVTWRLWLTAPCTALARRSTPPCMSLTVYLLSMVSNSPLLFSVFTDSKTFFNSAVCSKVAYCEIALVCAWHKSVCPHYSVTPQEIYSATSLS